MLCSCNKIFVSPTKFDIQIDANKQFCYTKKNIFSQCAYNTTSAIYDPFLSTTEHIKNFAAIAVKV